MCTSHYRVSGCSEIHQYIRCHLKMYKPHTLFSCLNEIGLHIYQFALFLRNLAQIINYYSNFRYISTREVQYLHFHLVIKPVLVFLFRDIYHPTTHLYKRHHFQIYTLHSPVFSQHHQYNLCTDQTQYDCLDSIAFDVHKLNGLY